MTPANDPPPLLDWRAPQHWSRRLKQCRFCPDLTNLRDHKGRPAHKICAQQARAAAAAALEEGTPN